MPHIKNLGWAIGLVLLLGCGTVALYQDNYNNGNQNSGISLEKQVGDYQITVRYLTPEELSQRDAEENIGLEDSLRKLYSQSRAFLMTIQGRDYVPKGGVQDYRAFKAQSEELYFHLADYIELKTESSNYRPVLAQYLNTYELDKRKQFYLVFCEEESSGDLFESPTLKLTFTDELFHSGISHFTFRATDIDKPI